MEDIEGAKEAFISSTTKNVLPVLEIDGKPVGSGKPGKITGAIYKKICELKEEFSL
jgi:D-alanine transaminase/branched-chain amino acid aminotransferase